MKVDGRMHNLFNMNDFTISGVDCIGLECFTHTTFNNISVISWQTVLLVEETVVL